MSSSRTLVAVTILVIISFAQIAVGAQFDLTNFPMATKANVGVNDAENLLTLDRTPVELKGLKKKNFSFIITQIDDAQSQAEFQVTDNNGQILRRNISKPFTTGAIQKKSIKLTKDAFVVEIEKHSKIILDNYF